MKEKNKKLFQIIFLAFMIGVFFYILNYLTLFFTKVISLLSPLFGPLAVIISFISFLLWIFFFFAYKFPWLLHLEDKWIINLFKKISIFFGIVVLIFYFVILIKTFIWHSNYNSLL